MRVFRSQLDYAPAEGDVAKKAYSETTPLSRFWQGWDGALVPAQAYARLEAYLKTVVH